MKKLNIFLIPILIILLFLSLGTSEPPRNTPYKTLRAISSTNDTGLAADGAKWSNISSSVERTGNIGRGGVIIIFKLTDATSETANWVLYGAKTRNCPAEFIAYGTCTAGSTQTGETNEYYANAITITNQDWLKTVSIVDGYQYNLGTGVVTNGGISKLFFDSCEYEYLLCLMSKGTCATAGAEFGTFY